MKKTLYVILALAIILSLVACGKSEKVLNVEKAINEIGVVTIDSESKIINAENTLNDLEEKEKDKIENINILNEARSAYNNLKKEQVEIAIENIGTVSFENEELIKTIRKQYEECNDEIKKSIINYQILVDAEKELSKQRANQIIVMIEKIGSVTLSDEDIITEAKVAYDKLSSEEKELVTNREVLLDAPNKLKELKLSSAKAGLKVTTDKVEGITWYESKSQPYYADTRSYVLPYIGQSSSKTWLKLQYRYTGDSWIFFDSVTIVIDGEKHTKTFGYNEVDRDNDTEVWEWVHVNPTSSDIDMLWKIANSKETIVRFQGDTKHYDMTVSSADKKGIKDVLTAYELMK